MSTRVIDSQAIVCHKCGRTWRYLSDFQDVRPLGLALKASCPVCGAVLAVNPLWRQTSVLVKNGRTQQKNT